MSHTALGIIYFIAFSHAVMLALSLYQRTSSGSSGRILAIMAAIVGYKLFEGGALYSGFYHFVPHAMDLLPGEVLLLGPMFFLYVSKVSGRRPFTSKLWPLHFIPALLIWMFNVPSVWRSADAKIAMWQQVLLSTNDGALPIQWVVLLLAIKVHLSIYLILSWQNIKSFEHAAENLRADNSHSVLLRMHVTAIALFSLEAIWVGLFVAQQFWGLGTLALVSDIWLLFVAFFVLALGYIGLQSPELVFEQEEKTLAEQTISEEKYSEPAAHEQSEKVKYLHSALPESTLNVLAEALETQLKDQKLYLDDKLSLTKLAKKTDIRSHTLSQVINQCMETNFYKLINGYRVQHAVSLIEDPDLHWPLERIALESGFSNRVTFVKAFKEVMFCTPSAYKKQNKHNRVS